MEMNIKRTCTEILFPISTQATVFPGLILLEKDSSKVSLPAAC